MRRLVLALSASGATAFFNTCPNKSLPKAKSAATATAAADVAEIPKAFDLPDDWLAPGREHNLGSIEEYREMYQKSIETPDVFWREIAEQFEWRGKALSEGGLHYNFDRSAGPIEIEWFKGSTTNLAFNALDRQVAAGRGDQVAIFTERNDVGEKGVHQPDSYTYVELLTGADKRGCGTSCCPSPLPHPRAFFLLHYLSAQR